MPDCRLWCVLHGIMSFVHIVHWPIPKYIMAKINIHIIMTTYTIIMLLDIDMKQEPVMLSFESRRSFSTLKRLKTYLLKKLNIGVYTKCISTIEKSQKNLSCCWSSYKNQVNAKKTTIRFCHFNLWYYKMYDDFVKFDSTTKIICDL